MFTGIVEELGEVVAVTELERAARISVRAPTVIADAALGDSIAVNGVCLTVMEIDDEVFAADVMAETLHRSDLGALIVGSRVNLERAMTMQQRLGGHIVQGHVDGVGTVLSRESTENWDILKISLPDEIARYVVEKGSITVDGVSLTVAALDDTSFSVSLIPTTLAMTSLGAKGTGQRVNLEVDVIAKYVERLMIDGGVDGRVEGGDDDRGQGTYVKESK